MVGQGKGRYAGHGACRPRAWQDRAMTRRAPSKKSPTGRQTAAAAAGCLIVVTAADQQALDLLLTAVRRRMPESALEFPMRITTRRSGSRDAEIAVTRNLFREIERDSAFIAQWEADGHRFGLPNSLHELLMQGKSAVIVAPAEVVAELQETFPIVRVVRLAGQLDAARAPLAPRACLRRIVGPRLAARLEARITLPRTDAVSHPGDLPSAVRALTEALARIVEERERRKKRAAPPAQSRGRREGRPAASSAAF